ncbi:MAG TPA: histidine kinase dimerization/phospho-acceptor domain-containing protein, partial [Ramlibacter sp.]|nr:histidine kinase dimerization/phospho-acceptor domain-containing protein [Ramlibacter sp.]
MDTISDEIFIADPQSLRYLYANASALRSLGYPLDQLRAMTVTDITRDPDRAALESYVARLQRGEPEVVFGATRQRNSGEVYPVEVRWQLLSTQGQPVIMSIVQDVTQRKEMDRLKDEFISVVNHELRTPLTSIHGAVKLLQQGAAGVLPESAMRLVTLAADNTDRLRRIVDDILQLEQIASGRMEFRLEPLAAAAVVEQLAHGYEAAAHTAGVALAAEAPAGLLLRA